MQTRAARALAGAAAVLAGTVVVTSSAGAQDDPEQPVPMTLEVEPTSGAPGDPFTVSGTGCFDTFGRGHRVAAVFFQERDGDPPWFAIQIDFTSPVPIDADGSWVGHLEVPRDDPQVGRVMDPDLDHEVYVTCIVRDEQNVEQENPYPLVPFDVLLAAPEPPAPTPPPTAPPATVPAPPPATPVVTDPPFPG